MDDKHSNSPYDPLDDLFKDFEDEDVKFYDPPKKKEGTVKPDAPDNDNIRKNRVETFSLNLDNTDIPKYEGEVYFSNPPQPNRRAAAGGQVRKNQTARAEKTVAAKKDSVQKRSFTKRTKNTTDKGGMATQGNTRLKWLAPTASSLVVILVIIGVLSIFMISFSITALGDIFGISRDSAPVEVTITDKENTTSSVIKALDHNGLVTNSTFCKIFAKYFDFSDKGYTPGVYTLSADMGLEKMLTKIKVASTSTETVTLTLPEGWTIDQIADKLETYEVCSKSAFLQTVNTIDFSNEFAFLKGIGNRESRYRVLEGFMFPDTYEFYIGESPSSVIKRFLNNFSEKWSDDYQKQADKLGVSVDQIIILASIIEREAYSQSQMASISSVLHNRLDKPSVFPTLQCDSTTSYLQEYVKPNCSSSQYVQFVQNYDSYLCNQYPAGAIANPGLNAIKAALYPDDTDYYYFQHDKNGTIYYASTASEHRSNTEKVWKVNNS